MIPRVPASLPPRAEFLLLAALAAATLAGCQLPAVNLATNEPIKVDIAMRLDVYQHDAGSATPKPAATPAPGPAGRPKDREADIQVFKNSRLVGEAHDGRLVILTEPAGDYGDYVRRIVAGENSERMTRMKALADKQKRPLPEIQKEQAALWANRSFKGEWIETPRPDGGYQWTQKQG